ncbi:MAG: hypothetical protein FJY20_02830 [Bacteroidetes bacterium]|nr:hypothetical protein [Bacteroidota bacterium]
MKMIFVVAVWILLLSCRNSAITKKLKGSDSLVITFNAPNSDSVINTVSTTETKAIQKLARFLDGKPSDKKDCGFDGNMLFFKAGIQVMPVVFKYSKTDCRQFTYDLDNTVMKTGMSNEAADFLKSLAEGKNWY